MIETPTASPLIPSLRRVAQHLVRGATNTDIASAEGLSEVTVHSYLKDIRQLLGLPPRASRAVITRALLDRGEVTAPDPGRPAPELTAEHRLLLWAIATTSRQADIAFAARLAPADLHTRTEALLSTAGASDPVHLILLARAWGLLQPPGEDGSAPGLGRLAPSSAAQPSVRPSRLGPMRRMPSRPPNAR
ncbi:LuxR C-terminal-related transcriptional regulator [Streptomyces sp. bgisy060]|uniref:LuxR C-terminal-related transcriptional regulator n=1 Tax=Streptomyces sp. bgisy060 TaxID=3413775 RepID=UPI003EB773EE